MLGYAQKRVAEEVEIPIADSTSGMARWLSISSVDGLRLRFD